MELLQVVALLCAIQPATGSKYNDYSLKQVDKYQLECQQGYVHCIRTKSNSMQEHHRLEQCIMEKK